MLINAVDTRIDYHDLSFKIGKCEKPTSLGQYFPRTNTIIISDLLEKTVAHEIGHYLDYKWARQYGSNYTPLSDSSYVAIPEGHQEWAKKYRTFVHNLMDKSDIISEYTQKPSEVFARFVAKFSNWCSGNRYSSHERSDKFSVQDYMVFVKLLQEKSYLDAKFPIS